MFDGMVSDSDIVEIARDRFNSIATLLGIGIDAMALAGAWYAIHSGFSLHWRRERAKERIAWTSSPEEEIAIIGHP